jgi:hypothetical protein
MSLVVLLRVVFIGRYASVGVVHHAALAGYVPLMEQSFAVGAGFVNSGKGTKRLLVSESLRYLTRL